MAAVKLTVNFNDLAGLTSGLNALSPQELSKRLVAVTNEQAESAYELSRKSLLRGVNLTDSYVKSRFEVNLASAKNPEAEVIATARDRKDLTLLSHYGVQMRTAPVKNPERSKGRSSWGIPKGYKQINPSVSVVTPKVMKSSKAFVIPTKTDSEGNPLVFKRVPGRRTKNNKTKLEILKGPSVYQLFRETLPNIEGRIGDDYQAAILAAAEAQITEALT